MHGFRWCRLRACTVFDTLLPLPTVDKVPNPLLTVIPMQLLSDHIAAHRGLDGSVAELAKSVTVE